MTTDTYNGWTNRETRAAHLWLTNDEAVYTEAREVIAQLVDKASIYNAHGFTKDSEARRQRFVAEGLADLMDNLLDDYEIIDDKTRRAMQADIGSLWRVNWREIAEHMMDEE